MKSWVLAVALIIGVLTAMVIDSSAESTEYSGLSKNSGYISVPNGRLYYEDAGQGTCIAFIHDGMLHSEAYDPQFASLAKDYRVVRYDRRRYGRSDSADQPYSDINDLKAVFDTLKIDSALLVGCSAGGRLAIDFTLKHGNLVTGLVLIGPVVSGMGFSDHMITRGGHLTNEIRNDPALFRSYWVDTDPYEFYPTNTGAKARARAMLAAFPQNLNLQNDYLIQGPDRPAVRFLNEIKVPTLVIVGEADIADVHAHAGAIQAGVGNAHREIVPEAGHLVALEKPQEVTDLIRSFLLESAFFSTISRDGILTAVEAYQTSLAQTPEAKPLSENRLNQMGYENLQYGEIDDALALFKLAVDIYPNSSNVYDSYGEALLASGDTTGAVANYKRSLELNPDNTNAARVLDQLQMK